MRAEPFPHQGDMFDDLLDGPSAAIRASYGFVWRDPTEDDLQTFAYLLIRRIDVGYRSIFHLLAVAGSADRMIRCQRAKLVTLSAAFRIRFT